MHTPSHSCYSKGCRRDECRRAHRDYEREAKRRRERPYGPGPIPMLDADEARAHLLWLASQGVGLRRIRAHTGIAWSTLRHIRQGTTKRIRLTTHNTIMAVNTASLPPVPGRHPHKQPNWSADEGHPRADRMEGTRCVSGKRSQPVLPAHAHDTDTAEA